MNPSEITTEQIPATVETTISTPEKEKRVQWSYDEMRAISTPLVIILKSKYSLSEFPQRNSSKKDRRHLVEAINQAQKLVLPENRRIDITNLGWITNKMFGFMIQAWDKDEKKDAPIVVEKTQTKTKDSLNRVIWTKEEKTIFAKEIARRLKVQGFPAIPQLTDRVGRGFFISAVREAQGVLARDRRKSLGNGRVNQFLNQSGVSPLIDQMLKLHLMDLSPPAKEETNNRKIEIAPLNNNNNRVENIQLKDRQDIPAEVTPEIIQTLKVQNSKNGPIAQAFYNLADLLNGIENKTIEHVEMQNLLMEELAELRSRIQKSETFISQQHTQINELMEMVTAQAKSDQIEEDKKDIPIVAILGCRKYEFDEIERKSKELNLPINLRHYDQDSRIRPISAQWAVSMKFTTHSWQSQVDNAIAKGQSAFLRGGTTQVVRQLETWFAELAE